MPAAIRPAVPADSETLGRILYSAFATLAEKHQFPREFPSVEVATRTVAMFIGNPGYVGLVAEEDGRILGSNFADTRSAVMGIGPITVDPEIQNKGVGRQLMNAMLAHAVELGAVGVRLVQAAYHNRSLCLYSELGFRVREPLSLLQGPPIDVRFPGYDIRTAIDMDRGVCNGLCRAIHGFDRDRELAEAISLNQATVVEHLGGVVGYATGLGFRCHAVAGSNTALQALIGAAPGFSGPGFLLPTRNHEVFTWCLRSGLKLVMQSTLMAQGLYAEPDGCWLPSIHY